MPEGFQENTALDSGSQACSTSHWNWLTGFIPPKGTKLWERGALSYGRHKKWLHIPFLPALRVLVSQSDSSKLFKNIFIEGEKKKGPGFAFFALCSVCYLIYSESGVLSSKHFIFSIAVSKLLSLLHVPAFRWRWKSALRRVMGARLSLGAGVMRRSALRSQHFQGCLLSSLLQICFRTCWVSSKNREEEVGVCSWGRSDTANHHSTLWNGCCAPRLLITLQMLLPSLQFNGQELNMSRKNCLMGQTANQVLQILHTTFNKSLCDNSSGGKQFALLPCLWKMSLLGPPVTHAAPHPGVLLHLTQP